MAATAFVSLWDELRQPSPDELRRLRTLIDALLANPALQERELSKQQQMDLAMLKGGLLSRVPQPPSEEAVKAFQDFKPIPIQGEPLSETIIKECRLVAARMLESSAVVKGVFWGRNRSRVESDRRTERH